MATLDPLSTASSSPSYYHWGGRSQREEPSPAMPGVVPRDPDDDKIIACAVAAGAGYLVTRDRDLLSLDRYEAIEIISPETFLRIVRQEISSS